MALGYGIYVHQRNDTAAGGSVNRETPGGNTRQVSGIATQSTDREATTGRNFKEALRKQLAEVEKDI